MSRKLRENYHQLDASMSKTMREKKRWSIDDTSFGYLFLIHNSF